MVTAVIATSAGLLWGFAVAPVVLGALSFVAWRCWSGRWRGWLYQDWDAPFGKLSFGYAGSWIVTFLAIIWLWVWSIVLPIGFLAEEVFTESPFVQAVWVYAARPVAVPLVVLLPFFLAATWNSLEVHTKVYKRGRFPWSMRLLAPRWFKDEVLRQVGDMPDEHTPPPGRGLPPERGGVGGGVPVAGAPDEAGSRVAPPAPPLSPPQPSGSGGLLPPPAPRPEGGSSGSGHPRLPPPPSPERDA